MELKERLQTARKRAGKTQAEVAQAFGVTPQAVSQWERGEAVPEHDKLLPLARLYGVEPGWLLGEGNDAILPPLGPAGSPRPAAEFLGERDLKVFAAVEGGPGEMVVSIDPVELVPRPWYMREVRDGYAVLVVGDSMVPAFKPGDMAIVNPRLPPLRGQDVILVGGEHEGEFRASIKHLEGWDAKTWHLRQYNPPRGQKHELRWSRRDWPKALRVVGKYYGG
jgi:transcriptional regulator with XRE-family HTH domain